MDLRSAGKRGGRRGPTRQERHGRWYPLLVPRQSQKGWMNLHDSRRGGRAGDQRGRAGTGHGRAGGGGRVSMREYVGLGEADGLHGGDGRDGQQHERRHLMMVALVL